MKYRFQHFVDISTSAETMQIINFNVGGKDVIGRCAHLFNAYKYFKLGKVSVKFVPASTLPVDPLGMSYNDTDPQTVDPRDQLNPGLVRITNGEDLMTDLTGVGGATQERMYQAMMLDPRWYKFNLQSGFKRTAVPLYWQVGQLHQDQYPGANVNVPVVGQSPNINQVGVATFSMDPASLPITSSSSGQVDLPVHYQYGTSDVRGFFQTGHRGRLGFLPTDAYEHVFSSTDGASGMKAMIHNVPSIRTITCVLPKAYKTIYYYRVYITETVYFSGLRSIAPVTVDINQNSYEANTGIDQFIVPPTIYAHEPGSYSAIVSPNFPLNNGEYSDDN